MTPDGISMTLLFPLFAGLMLVIVVCFQDSKTNLAFFMMKTNLFFSV